MKRKGCQMAQIRFSFLQFVALAVLATADVHAAPVKLVGFNDMSCRAWSESKGDAERRKEYLAWVSGVLSGHNYANQKQQTAAVSSGTVENFVNRFCAEKPQGDFSDAAFRMSDSFSGRNQAITK